MYRFLKCLVLLIAALTIGVRPASAVTATADQTIDATVSSVADLTLGATTVTFASADPSVSSSIVQSETGSQLDVTADARTTANGSVTLTVIAAGDLSNGSTTIPIGNVSWAGTGSGFVASGTLSTIAQTLGSWTGSGEYTGTLTYSLANSWEYVSSATPYSVTLTYTLTAP